MGFRGEERHYHSYDSLLRNVIAFFPCFETLSKVEFNGIDLIFWVVGNFKTG